MCCIAYVIPQVHANFLCLFSEELEEESTKVMMLAWCGAALHSASFKDLPVENGNF